MAAAGAHLFLGSSPPFSRRELSTSLFISRRANHRHSTLAPPSYAVTERAIPITEISSFRENGSLQKGEIEVPASRAVETAKSDESPEEAGKSLKDFFEESRELIRSDGGPPRWFSPLECGSRRRDSPLLLYLPGIDGTGLGLIMHHHRLGKIFDIWCMHIPVKDRTPFSGLVTLVQRTVRLENKRSPYRPIYLVGESLGGCIALDVAARNPDIDLVLILANPATSFGKSQLQLLLPLMKSIPEELGQNLPDILHLVTAGENRLAIALESFLKALPLPQAVEELSNDVLAHAHYLPVLADMVPKGTLLWKLQMLNVASQSANSHLHAVKAQILILCSGNDIFLPSQEEGHRLQCSLPRCGIRGFKEKGHFLFLEDDVDLVTVLKGASFYRRRKFLDYVSDYIPPTHSEFKNLYDLNRWMIDPTSPVMLSTLENGELVKGLGGIPSEGPVLLVGYHMMGGLDMVPLLAQFFIERNILVRGLAHPLNFMSKDSILPRDRETSNLLNILLSVDSAAFDGHRTMGPVPVSGENLYKLLASKSYVLLYPGGLREAHHRKGEEYKLFWPERCEFVRMAAQFGTKIVPFGAVGEDDFLQLVLDYNDQIRIPFLKSEIEAVTKEVASLRTDAKGEVADQDIHVPVILPKVPGRLYLYFGKPIETEEGSTELFPLKGKKAELRDREKAHEVYLHVKSEVERCIAFLKEKREQDPYRNLLPRLLYQASNGFTAEVPTFEL